MFATGKVLEPIRIPVILGINDKAAKRRYFMEFEKRFWEIRLCLLPSFCLSFTHTIISEHFLKNCSTTRLGFIMLYYPRVLIPQNLNFAKITLSKIDDAERVVDDLTKIKCREDDKKCKFYDENHDFTKRSENEPDLRYFIELLNILDQELLADESMIKIRRNWKPDKPIEARASWTTLWSSLVPSLYGFFCQGNSYWKSYSLNVSRVYKQGASYMGITLQQIWFDWWNFERYRVPRLCEK